MISSNAQVLLNGDLEGVVTDVSQLPQYWEAVPFDNPICEASHDLTATPDLTSIDGPLISQGVFGYADSGNSFISAGLGSVHDSLTNEEFYYHEGIAQYVQNWRPGCEYKLTLSQTIVKQSFNGGGALDSSGYWKVFLDDFYQDKTQVVFSAVNYNSEFLEWDVQQLTIIPTREQHYLQFLPFDDDGDTSFELNDGLRMGIDNIKLEAMNVCYSALEMPNVFTPNEDGINDFFSPVAIYGITEFKLEITNRWGNAVFETDDPKLYWDGTDTEEGTYFWKVNYVDLDGRELEQQGFLTLIR